MEDFNSGQKSGRRQANTGVTVSTDTYVEVGHVLYFITMRANRNAAVESLLIRSSEDGLEPNSRQRPPT